MRHHLLRDLRHAHSPPQNRSFVHLLPLLPESQTSERLCQLRDVSEDILCVSKDIVSLTLLALGGEGGRCFPRKFCLPVDNLFSFGSIATKFGDFS